MAISPQTPAHSRALTKKLELTFALLSDGGNQVARQCGLVFALDDSFDRAARISTLLMRPEVARDLRPPAAEDKDDDE